MSSAALQLARSGASRASGSSGSSGTFGTFGASGASGVNNNLPDFPLYEKKAAYASLNLFHLCKKEIIVKNNFV
jgi:hypothetical protein